MKLPHLDQFVELQRGEAATLAGSIADALNEALCTPLGVDDFPGDVPAVPVRPLMALAITPLKRLFDRLERRQLQELTKPLKRGARPPKPWRLRLSYDELVAIRTCVTPDCLLATVVLGKVHQKSLNLEPYILL
ncbi:hypothetical protein [Hymenobacter crusticola]|uniref:Uncharacterized protein n=1 Tax=Hymenobacter crusticola TaxID=1770526 RepID=A0A243W5C7_9BACT|nr:hypothetical protein [Hymenobacter crusticola]OUJ68608.1 hypothetical protein BXP70_27820 [Hymenobacter crusticola]